jgi:hypothetical protein
MSHMSLVLRNIKEQYVQTIADFIEPRSHQELVSQRRRKEGEGQTIRNQAG